MGAEALRLLEEVRREFDLGIVTEATEVETFDEVERTADLVQLGARNMQNFALLKRAGRSAKPVLLKRGPRPPWRSGCSPPSTSCPRATATSSCASGASAPGASTPATPWT